ncbi:MAG TPA: biosynthetic arginine decarboxylase, partial [Rhodanobacteraceae bacterium]
MTDSWDIERARHTYAVAHWGAGYFDINDDGDLAVRPARTHGPRLPLPELVDAARAQGLRLPLLLRFPDILADRLARMRGAFAQATREADYAGGYTAIYPIKVNQQRGVAGELVRVAGEQADGVTGFGLEAGSKPELMAVLALAAPGSRVVCNGYKDRQYVRLALIGRAMGLDVRIVIEKPDELEHVIAEAAALGIRPSLGVRVRLASIGAGKWQNTGGEKGKFGLSPRQVLRLIERAREVGLVDCLTLLHFHMGSQISNLRDIATGMREAVRHYVELRRMGLPIDTVDAGGGLGVDYEGTRSRSYNSINYTMAQYAAAIVTPLAQACRDEHLPMPHLMTEAGRAMTAHHALLVVDVTEVEATPDGTVVEARADEPAVLTRLREVHAALDERPLPELYQEARFHLTEGQTLYALGQLSLADRAQLEDAYYAIANAVRARINPAERAHRPVLDDLDARLVDKYFGNFSVFESTPDVWAIDQVFPVMP